MRHVSEVLVPGFGHPVLLCQGKMPLARGLHTFEMVTEHFANLNLSVVVAKCWLLAKLSGHEIKKSKKSRYILSLSSLSLLPEAKDEL